MRKRGSCRLAARGRIHLPRAARGRRRRFAAGAEQKVGRVGRRGAVAEAWAAATRAHALPADGRDHRSLFVGIAAAIAIPTIIRMNSHGPGGWVELLG